MDMKLTKTELYNHILGGIYGQAIGDSFGISSALHPFSTEKEFGWINTFLKPSENHPMHCGLPAGKVTDDTEQAMAIAYNIIRDKKVSLENTIESIIKWYDSVDGDNNKYVGPSTQKAVQKLRNGSDPTKTGLTGYTNGSSMRISPVGLLNVCCPKKAAEDALITCIPSHFTYPAVSATCSLAASISVSVMPGSTIESIIDTGKEFADLYQFKGSNWFSPSISRRINFGVEIVKDNSKSIKNRLLDVYDLIGCGFLASESVPSAFSMFYLGNGDLMKTVEYCANLSGDADTIGAMACSLAGSFSGFSQIPIEVINIIDKTNPKFNFRKIASDLLEVSWERLNNKK